MKSLLAAAAGLMLGAQAAQAGWSFSENVVPSSVQGLEVHQFFAKLDPTTPDEAGPPAAKGLQSVDATLTLTTPGAFTFKQVDVDQDGIMDVAATGTLMSDAIARTGTSSALGSFIRAGNGTPFFTAFASPNNLSVDKTGGGVNGDEPDGVPDPGQDATVNYQNLKTFRIVGVAQNSFDPKAISDPKGALFALAVVPTGSKVSVTGQVASDVGALTDIVIPEPTALGFVGLAGLALARRRRVA